MKQWKKVGAVLLSSALVVIGMNFISRPAEAEEVRAEGTVYDFVLVPDEKYWEWEENADGTVRITGFDDCADYDYEDYWAERESYQLAIPESIAGKTVVAVGPSSRINNTGGLINTRRDITSIKVPEGITEISCLGYELTGLVSVELPTTLKIIGDYAFYKALSLRNISIPDKVKEIGTSAFNGCENLETIQLPEGLEEIQDTAFSGCKSLKKITIPASVTRIVEYEFPGVFYDCWSMEAIEVSRDNKKYFSENGILYRWKDQDDYPGEKILICYPGGKEGVCNVDAETTDIVPGALLSAKGLTAINVDSENPDYSSVDGVLYSKDLQKLYVCPAGKGGAYTIPEGVEYLDKLSFSYSSLSSLSLPDSLGEVYESEYGETDSVGELAFVYCDSLQSLSIGKNMTDAIVSKISVYGGNNFSYAKNLKNIAVSQENPHITAVNHVLYDKQVKTLLCVPQGMTGGLVIPDTVETIGSAFATYNSESEMSNLTEITIPASVTDIRCPAYYLSGVTVKGYSGSAAEEYAKKANITFIPLDGSETPQTPVPTQKPGTPSEQPVQPTQVPTQTKPPVVVTDIPELKGNSPLTLTDDGILTGLTQNRNTVKEIAQAFTSQNLVFKDMSGAVLAEDATLGTGATVSVMDGDTVKASCQVVLAGDVTGDGKVNGKDVSMAARSLVGKATLNDAQKSATDVQEDGAVNGKDVSMLARSLVGKSTIASQGK